MGDAARGSPMWHEGRCIQSEEMGASRAGEDPPGFEVGAVRETREQITASAERLKLVVGFRAREIGRLQDLAYAATKNARRRAPRYERLGPRRSFNSGASWSG